MRLQIPQLPTLVISVVCNLRGIIGGDELLTVDPGMERNRDSNETVNPDHGAGNAGAHGIPNELSNNQYAVLYDDGSG